MNGKQKAALRTAKAMLDRYWDGTLPVDVRSFVEKEGLDVHFFEGMPKIGKWHAESEAIALGTGLTDWQARYALARNLGLACSCEDSELFARALLLPQQAFINVVADRKKTIREAADLFSCDYDFCESWADFLKSQGLISKKLILF